jgi:acyl-CoA dehydrogenase
MMQEDNDRRMQMVEGTFIPKREGESLKRILDTFKVVKSAEAIEKKIRMALKEKKIPKVKGPKLIEEALKAGIITMVESENLKKAETMRLDAITVDDFSQEEYLGHSAGIIETVKHALKM